MNKITAFPGSNIPGEPSAEIISEMESLLAEAKAGQIIGLAYCTVRPSSKGTGWVGVAGTAEAIGMAVSMLQHRYVAYILGGQS